MNSQGAHDDLASHDGREPVTRTAAEWLWALLPIGGSVFCLSALVYYHLHHDDLAVASTLQVLIAGIYRFLGFAPAFLFFLLLLSWSSIWFVVGRIDRPMGRLLRLAAMTVMLGVLMNLGEGRAEPAFRKGELGAWLAEHLVASFGYYPSLVMVWAVTFGALLLATDYFFSEYFERLRPSEERADEGVEAAVTDHLKQLGTVPGPARREAETGPAVVEVRSEPAAGAAVPHGAPSASVVADDAEVDVEPLVDVPTEPAVYRPRRRSYFDRRQAEDVAESAFGRVDESWVPTGPDAQEIENPEIGTGAAATTAEPARESAPVVEADGSGVSGSEHVDEVVVEAVAEVVVEPSAEAADAAPTAEPELALPAAPLVAESPADESAAVAAVPGEGAQAAASEPPLDAAEAEASASEEPIVPIPRPEVVPERSRQERVVTTPREPELPRDREGVRQQVLFGPNLDDVLVAEAVEAVTTWRRASATFLQRKLRIDYDLACRVMAELGRRGIVELEADATHGRVLG